MRPSNLWDQLDQHINGFFEKVKLQDLAKTTKNKYEKSEELKRSRI